MTRLDAAPEILALAAELGVSAAAPVDGILDSCRSRIDRWVAEARGVTTIGQLEALVTQRLQMVFEEIRSDADFARITDLYARAKKDPVFATMRFRFDDAENPTFGALVRRNVGDDAPDRFVAVIDCRGSKLARRFFTRWHEIAHRLTTHADEGATEPAYRSEHDPIERMMDEIAGHRRLLRAVLRAGVPSGARQQGAADVRDGEGGPGRRLPGGQLPGHAECLRQTAADAGDVPGSDDGPQEGSEAAARRRPACSATSRCPVNCGP